MRAVGWVVGGAVALLAALAVDPVTRAVSTWPGAAQLVGARVWLVLALLVAALVTASAAVLLGRRGRRGERPRRWSGARLVATAVVLVLVAAGHAAVLLPRGLGAGTVVAAHTERTDEITVVTVNVLAGGRASTDDLVALVRATGADVLAVTESARWYRDLLATRLHEAGLPFQRFTGDTTTARPRGSVLFVSPALGRYCETSTDSPGVLRVEPADGAGPPLVVAHPRSLPRFPVGPSSITGVQHWHEELLAVRNLMAGTPGGVVLGDLNATPDHAPLTALPGGYVDAARVAGIAAHGTFPSWLPGWLGVGIDHVLLDAGRWAVVAAGATAVEGTDHRAVVVRLRPA